MKLTPTKTLKKKNKPDPVAESNADTSPTHSSWKDLFDFRNFKIGKLLTVGVAMIVGLMVAATVYSNYLSSAAFTIIRTSTTRIFDVLTIQRDTEEFYSAISDVDIIDNHNRLDSEKQKIDDLYVRAVDTVEGAEKEEIFEKLEAEKALQALEKTKAVTENIFELKRKTIDQSVGDIRDVKSDESKWLNGYFIETRNLRFDVLGVFHEMTIRSDEEFGEAMEDVRRAQVLTWIVIGISLVLVTLLAAYLVRSVKKIFDLKNEFVNIIAHDLRNPVTAITGYLEMVSSQKDKKVSELGEDLLAMTVSAQKLRTQISNLLEVGRTEAGRQKLFMEAVNPYEVIADSVLRAKALAQVSGMKIVNKSEADKNVFVKADKSKLSDVLDNLISNAIKYNSQNGTVTVSTKVEGDLFSILVSDTGAGIPNNQKDKIFKRYSRLNTDKEKKVSGTGLGLYTVKLAMDQMNGTVIFRSKENEGTTFTVSFKKVDQKDKPEFNT